MFEKESGRLSKALEAGLYGLGRKVFTVWVKVLPCEKTQGVEAPREG
jgi:hypothetical protein